MRDINQVSHACASTQNSFSCAGYLCASLTLSLFQLSINELNINSSRAKFHFLPTSDFLLSVLIGVRLRVQVKIKSSLRELFSDFTWPTKIFIYEKSSTRAKEWKYCISLFACRWRNCLRRKELKKLKAQATRRIIRKS